MLHDKRVPLISATGSCRMGYRVGEVVGERLGRTILELGGNNAIIVTEHADLDMADRAILFGAVGTAGQRCTSTRRIICHEKVFDTLRSRLVKAYEQVQDRRSVGRRHADGPADRQRRRRRHDARHRAGQRAGRHHPVRRRKAQRREIPRRLLRHALHRRGEERLSHRAGRDLRADPVLDPLQGPGRGHRAAQRRAAGPFQRHLHYQPAGGGEVPSATWAATAASPT